MSTLDSSAPPNPAASNGLPAIHHYLPHPPNDLVGYHPQQSPVGHMPPHSSPAQQQPGAYLPQPNAYMPPGNHYTAQPSPYDGYPPPPHQPPYGIPHYPHAHPPSPYGQHFQPEFHHDPYQYAGFRNYITDPSGQSGPPGMKPRVTTTLWEDEGTLCFQVEAKGICVARREDNDMINGTKLLNVAGMSRGKRDGILKSEKARAVVKVGAMHLKGVWIPFDRALDFANKERIIDQLYPLFVQDIKAFLYHPSNFARTNAVMAAAAHRQTQSPGVLPYGQAPAQLPRRGSDVQTRPMMSDRSLSFPTPPSSASSITNGNADLPWVSQTGLTLDTSGLHPVTRSLPGTPATSPSSAVHQSNQTYGALTDSHIHRQSVNFDPNFKREITQLHLSYPTNSQFSSRRASSASDMGPPPSAVHSRLNTVDKDMEKHESLAESHEEGYPGEMHYGVPGTPISATSNQVYQTPSIVAMKGRGEAPGTPTHGQSPGANPMWSAKHEPPPQSEYSISSQSQHSRQLSYQMRGEDQAQMVSQNGVSRNIFDGSLDRDSKLSSLDHYHNDEVLPGDLPNGHNLSHGPLPPLKQEGLIKDGPPSKRRRTINQDSMPYGMSGLSPTHSTSDLSIPEGGLAPNGSGLNTSDPASWNISSSYADDYGTPVLAADPASGRKRPPSRK